MATAGWLCRGPLASRQRMHLPGMCVGGGAYSGNTVGASESACTPASSASLLLDAGMCSDIWLGKQFVQLLWHALRRLVANTLFQLAAPPRFCAPSAVSQPAVAVTSQRVLLLTPPQRTWSGTPPDSASASNSTPHTSATPGQSPSVCSHLVAFPRFFTGAAHGACMGRHGSNECDANHAVWPLFQCCVWAGPEQRC